MTTKECFERIGADYEDAVERLMTDERVRKYTIKFLHETSFESVKKLMEEENYDDAFKHAHNFKGICQNLSFLRLYEVAYELSEALREKSRDVARAKELLPAVEKCYQDTVSVISELAKEEGIQ